MNGVVAAAMLLAGGADISFTLREGLDCDAFGVFDIYGHCSHIVEDFGLAQDLARYQVFSKRRGHSVGEVVPMIRVSPGHYRRMERPVSPPTGREDGNA